MRRYLTRARNRQLVFLFIGILALQFIGFSLLLNDIPTIETGDGETEETIDNKEEEISAASSILPNITREGANLILKNESNPTLWNKLHGKHINNIRIAYFTEANEWKLTPFQLDEKAYLRTYKFEIGFHASAGTFGGITNVDLVNWVRFDVRHGYVGRHINDTSSAAYEEAAGSTKYDAEMSIWPSRQKENWQDGDADKAPTEPEQDPREQPGGVWEQIPRRIDYDDELVFPTKNGKQASIHSWWNYEEFPNRFRVKITDPVDGGQSWMYIYYNEENMENPPDKNYYIPPGEKSYVDWDKENLKITAENYELEFDPDNLDLYEALRIKLQGTEGNDLLSSSNKQYLSVFFDIYYEASGETLDVDGDTEVWREGQWDEGYFNEQFTTLGYGLDLDFSWGTNSEGERTYNNDPDGNDPVSQGYTDESNTHSFQDTTQDHWVAGEISAGDQERDGDTEEILPFVRGWFRSTENPDLDLISKQDLTDPQPFSGSHEAAIDGPLRVVLDQYSVQTIQVDLGDPVNYEEMWTLEHETLKFERDGIQYEPSVLDLDMSEDDGMDLEIRPHFAFMFTERYSDFVRNDPDAFIALGRAPNGVPGLPDFEQCDTAGQTKWEADYSNDFQTNSLILSPDADGSNDDVQGEATATYPNNPMEGHYDNTRLVTGSQEGNPLSDWKYLHTSSGGMWSYVPYHEWWELFTEETNRDLSTYWNDNTEYSESGLYANHGDKGGSTGEFVRKYTFANLSYWESLREYARLKNNLNDHVDYINESHPGGVIFEDSDLFVNDELQTNTPYLKNGDNVRILVDLNDAYGTELFEVDASSFTSVDPGVEVFDSERHIYEISFSVETTNPDRVPPLSGYHVNITVKTTPSGYYIEELYLDNEKPDPPDMFDAEQPAGIAQVDLTWSSGSDNGKLDYYVIYRDGQPVKTLDAPATEWTDTDVSDGQTYSYSIRVYDMAGNYNESTIHPEVTINLDFTPAKLAPLDPYFNDILTLNWSENPGDEDVIDNYRVHWAKDSEGPYNSLDWLPDTQTTFDFDPTAEESSPQNGTYYFKLESYNFDEDISIFSSSDSSLYDTEKPMPGAISDIPDEYYPSSAEISVEWGGYFDAFSGVDYFELYRSENSEAAEDYAKIATRPENKPYYYDTDLTNETTYRYYVRVYDKAGNFDDTPVEKVTYYDTYVDAEPNLKIGTVEVSKEEAEREELFDVNV
ncbi:MAG: hypothetical protein ACOC4M_12480, partial [Promethearchaeia archaeon]